MIFTLLHFFLILICLFSVSIPVVSLWPYFLGYPIEQFLKLTISIPPQGSRSSEVATAPQLLTTKYPHAYKRLRKYLHNMLSQCWEQIQNSSDPSIGHPVLREKGISNSVNNLKHQIELFWNCDYPFRVVDAEKITDPLDWWHDIGRHNSTKVLLVWNFNNDCGLRWEFYDTHQVLAIRIFSILINSMPDECTNSTITWFNLPTWGNQAT